jgi:CBS domain containing-hemolysin-like protein
VTDVLSLLVLVALLLGNAFFVAAEFALVSARADQLEPRAHAGSVRAQKTLTAMRNVSQMMAGAQLGITLCSLGLGAVGEPAVAHLIAAPLEAVGAPAALLQPVALVIALALVTALHMVLGEMVPKNITIAGPDRTAIVLGPPLAVLVRLLKPFIWFFNVTANGFVRLFGVQPTAEVTASFDEDEIRSMITQSRREGVLGSELSNLATGALTFEQHDVRSVLLDPASLITVPRESTPRQLEAVVAEHGYSRYPMRRADGSLAGYVHVKDVLGSGPTSRDLPVPDQAVKDFVRVSPDEPLPEVLQEMRRSGSHLGLVAAEGEVLGVVALEDVLEQLIGDVRGADVQFGSAGPTAAEAGAGAGGR